MSMKIIENKDYIIVDLQYDKDIHDMIFLNPDTLLIEKVWNGDSKFFRKYAKVYYDDNGLVSRFYMKTQSSRAPGDEDDYITNYDGEFVWDGDQVVELNDNVSGNWYHRDIPLNSNPLKPEALVNKVRFIYKHTKNSMSIYDCSDPLAQRIIEVMDIHWAFYQEYMKPYLFPNVNKQEN